MMEQPVYTSATRHRHHATPCPSCGQRRELGWVDVGSLEDRDRWSPSEKCRNRQCVEFRDPTSL